MRRFERPPAPDVLTAGHAKWTASWEAKCGRPGAAAFRWPTVRRLPLNKHLEEPLQAMTDGHCAYCDGYPTRGLATRTIDHFRPKSSFPALAFSWSNLYPACNTCQVRGDQWDDGLLAPDAPDYRFERYFWFDPVDGRVRINRAASPGDQARAEVTRTLFRLNDDGRPRLRRTHHRRWRRLLDEDPREWPYRFMFV